MSAQPQIQAAEEPAVTSASQGDLVDDVLGYHGGDPKLAIRELLADAAYLRGELYTASRLLSKGIGRGWRPSYDRAE
jgi:hypothetical protein